MAVDNSTSDPHTPRPQLTTVDVAIITVYFALNVAVGIWVRGQWWHRLGRALGRGKCPGYPWAWHPLSGGLMPLGPPPSPGEMRPR